MFALDITQWYYSRLGPCLPIYGDGDAPLHYYDIYAAIQCQSLSHLLLMSM